MHAREECPGERPCARADRHRRRSPYPAFCPGPRYAAQDRAGSACLRRLGTIRVEPVHLPLQRIVLDILANGSKIALIADDVVVERRLPELRGIAEPALLPDPDAVLVGGEALSSPETSRDSPLRLRGTGLSLGSYCPPTSCQPSNKMR